MARTKQIKSVTETPSPAEGKLEQQKASVARMALSVEEAAQVAGLSERYMWDVVKSGKLRTKRIGRRRLVPVDALQEFLK